MPLDPLSFRGFLLFLTGTYDFDFDKLSHICSCALDGVRISSLDLKSDAVPIKPPRQPWLFLFLLDLGL